MIKAFYFKRFCGLVGSKSFLSWHETQFTGSGRQAYTWRNFSATLEKEFPFEPTGNDNTDEPFSNCYHFFKYLFCSVCPEFYKVMILITNSVSAYYWKMAPTLGSFRKLDCTPYPYARISDGQVLTFKRSNLTKLCTVNREMHLTEIESEVRLINVADWKLHWTFDANNKFTHHIEPNLNFTSYS